MAESLSEFNRRGLLIIWRRFVGWRRFYMVAWWLLKLKIKSREA